MNLKSSPEKMVVNLLRNQVVNLTGLCNSESFSLFPNPTSENVNLAFKNKFDGEVSIEIYNQLGQLLSVIRKNGLMTNSIITLNTSGLVDGLYFVNVKTKEGMSSKKFVLVR